LIGVRTRKINSIPASTMIICNGCFEVLLSHGDSACFAGAQNTTIDILAIVAAVDASDHTPYYPVEIRELALMDDRYVSKLVFNAHNFVNF
jgi:hypothetical protein